MISKKTPKKTERKGVKQKRVKLALDAPDARSVKLAGDFNGWCPDSHLLTRDSKGKWTISMNLKPGRYEYRFLADGAWQNDPRCTTFSPNPFGGDNCVLTVK